MDNGCNDLCVYLLEVYRFQLQINGKEFDADTLVQKLARGFRSPDHQSFSWIQLGTDVGSLYNATPGNVAFAAGVYDDPVAATRKRKASRVVKTIAEAAATTARPTEVKDAPKEPQEQDTTIRAEAQIKRLKRKLRQTCEQIDSSATDGIHFLFHQTSFTQTIENLLYCSFLVKRSEAHVHVTASSSSIAATSTRRRHLALASVPAELQQDDLPPPSQAVVKLNMRDWRRLIKAQQEDDDDEAANEEDGESADDEAVKEEDIDGESAKDEAAKAEGIDGDSATDGAAKVKADIDGESTDDTAAKEDDIGGELAPVDPQGAIRSR